MPGFLQAHFGNVHCSNIVTACAQDVGDKKKSRKKVVVGDDEEAEVTDAALMINVEKCLARLRKSLSPATIANAMVSCHDAHKESVLSGYLRKQVAPHTKAPQLFSADTCLWCIAVRHGTGIPGRPTEIRCGVQNRPGP